MHENIDLPYVFEFWVTNLLREEPGYVNVFKFIREKKRFEKAKVNPRCFLWFPTAMFESLRWVPTWRLHTNREFKQIATAGATKAAVTEKVWREYVAAVCQILAKWDTKMWETWTKEFKISFI